MNRLFITLIVSAIVSLGATARQPQRGYRGFIDWSNDFRSETWVQRSNFLYTGISTSHGYQINPLVFVGAGLQYEHCSLSNGNFVTPFIHGRTDLKFGKFTPFGEVRLGYNLTDGGGVYFSPNIGYRFNWGRKVGINLGVGLTLLGYGVDMYDFITTAGGYTTVYKTGTRRYTNAYFSFRVGFDF